MAKITSVFIDIHESGTRNPPLGLPKEGVFVATHTRIISCARSLGTPPIPEEKKSYT